MNYVAQKGSREMSKRRRLSYEHKKKIVEEFERGVGTAQELGRKYGVHPINIYQWKKKFEEGSMVDRPTKREKELEKQLAQAERKLGQLLIERDLLKKLQEDISRRQKRSGGLKDTEKKSDPQSGPVK
jgi:transposase